MPELTRRAALMLGVGALGAGAFTWPTDALAATREANRPVRLSRPVALPLRSTYARAVGADFQARGAENAFVLRLVDILDVPRTPHADELSYNLIFEGRGRFVPASGIYRLATRGLPSTDLFLAPDGRQVAPYRLEALVNRWIPA